MVALRAQMAHTQIPPQKPMVSTSFSSCADAPASAEANRITVKNHTKSTLPRKLKTTSKKCRFESQNASQNRPRRPGRAPGPPPARDFRQNNFHFWLLPGSKNASKSKLEFEVIFEAPGGSVPRIPGGVAPPSAPGPLHVYILIYILA